MFPFSFDDLALEDHQNSVKMLFLRFYLLTKICSPLLSED
jgi:hypothetical protein